MGLLDDAIREHLELKRKHGAAEDELRRKEAEALGPARRDFAPEPAEEAEAVPELAEAPAVASDDAAGDYEPAPAPVEPPSWFDEEPPTAPAERMREAIEQLEVNRLDGGGVLKLTASFGVAALPGSVTDKRYLIAVADQALYRAKRGGKNRVERAEAAPEAAPGSR